MISHNTITRKRCDIIVHFENTEETKFLTTEAVMHISDINHTLKNVVSHQQCKYITSNATTIQSHPRLIKHD